jgi:hypothetical protein
MRKQVLTLETSFNFRWLYIIGPALYGDDIHGQGIAPNPSQGLNKVAKNL